MTQPEGRCYGQTPADPKEATELLGISRSKLYELLRAGTIESVKIGDCRRVPRAALDEYVERLRREAVA